MAAAAGAALALGVAGVAVAEDTTGLTTVDQRIVPAAGPGFDFLTTGAGESHTVRSGGFGSPGVGRESVRTQIAYFGQLSDFQLADEESPASRRVPGPAGPSRSSRRTRPWEALNPQIDDAMVRQLNEFTPDGEAPIAEGDGDRPEMDFSINTGDSGRQPAAERDRVGERAD